MLKDVPTEAVIKQWCVVLCVDSSISGGLNSLAAVTLQDVVRHFWFPDMHEHRATVVSKCIGESRLVYPAFREVEALLLPSRPLCYCELGWLAVKSTVK